MSKQTKLQRISIVFEETGGAGGKAFNVYLDGHTRRINQVNEKDLSPAEFWALKCFSIVADVIQKTGVVNSVTPRPDGGIPQ